MVNHEWKLFTQQVVTHYIRCQQGQIAHLTCNGTQVQHFLFFFFFPKFTCKLPNLKYIKLSYTIISRQGNYEKKLATNKPPSHKMREEGGQGLGAPHVSSLSALSYPFPHCLRPSCCSPPFPPHKQWIATMVRASAWWWWCWHWSSSSSSPWSSSSRGYGRCGPLTILVAPRFHPASTCSRR